MQKKTGKEPRQQTWLEMNERLGTSVPQLFAVLSAEDDFISLLVKLQADSTFLAVLKRYGPDGAPMVAFGSGYGYAGALMGLEGTIAANKWRVDKPYQP